MGRTRKLIALKRETVVNEEQAFLSAIAVNPADATTRLVFADWLTERDDPRGDWLRVRTQLSLLGPANDMLDQLEARECELAPMTLVSWLATEVPVWSLLEHFQLLCSKLTSWNALFSGVVAHRSRYTNSESALGGGLPYPPLPDNVAMENVQTWKSMTEFYSERFLQHLPYLTAIREFVASIAHTETAKLFRAGQSMTTFILSTIERHGLDPTDADVWISPNSKTPLFQLGYRPPNEGTPVTAECNDLTVLRLQFSQFLARLWCDTRGRRSFAQRADS